MIDVWGVFSNFLWILGLSVLLAVWSFASYEARLVRQKTREKLDEFGYALALDSGLLLFITGLAATEDREWARALWILLGVGVLVEVGMRFRSRARAEVDGAKEKVE